MNITELFRQSRLNNRAEYKSKEIAKLGVLRAGSSGVISDQGEVAGNCVRKAHLRSLGIELDPPTEDKLIMFDLGFASEDIVYAKLASALADTGHVILREEEIPIEWTTSNGTKVTGRPDVVICKAADELPEVKNPKSLLEQIGATPILGLELKSVHSLWVAREVLFNKKPKLPNVIQAAHYMWKLDVPYKLVYSGYSQLGQGMAGNEWIVKMFPQPGEPGSQYVEYSIKENKKTGKITNTIKHIKQFEIVYDLMIDNHGRVLYKLEEEEKWEPTLVTIPSIEKYFEYVSEMEAESKLGPRPNTIDVHGNKLNYTDCAYCPLQETCDTYEDKGYKKWLAEVLKFQAENAVKGNV